MKFKKISGILVLALALALVLNVVSCAKSSDKKTENTEQETSKAEHAENAVPDPQQPPSEDAGDTESMEGTAPEKELVALNKDKEPSGTGESTSQPVVKEKAETPPATETNTGKPGIDTESPAVVVVKKEETVVTPPPKTEPAAEKPKADVSNPLGWANEKDPPPPEEPKEEVSPPEEEKPQTTEPAPSNWVVPAKYRTMANPVKADGESISIGKNLYRKHCASCHGKTGLGDGPKAAQLDTPSGDFSLASFQKQTDGSLFYKTREGRDDMPGYKKKIPYEEDTWHMVNYMRTFK